MKKKHWRIFAAAVILLFALTAGAAWGFNRYYTRLLTPINKQNDRPITITIPSGASVRDMAQILEKKGLVRKAWAFEFYARWNHLNTYRSGTYSFNQTMSVGQLMNNLKNGAHRGIIVLVDVRQGMWVSEVAAQMANAAKLDKPDVLKKLKDHHYVNDHYVKKYPFLTNEIFQKGIEYPLEGYLAPGIYRFKKGKSPLTLDQMVNKMLDKTAQRLHSYSGEIKTNKLGSVHKILTMASLIEQEAPDQKNREKIAGVFYNRLDLDMRLQTDPSIAYGQQRRIRAYTKKDLKTDTPYNTYTRSGLTVGPIGAPALDAIEAVLRPIKSKNVYFYARPNGKVYYSQTYKQHQEVIAKYRHEWAEKS
ncbi:endolytic transglycosylase MltG [Sporolactobacillus terrae]|uniref:Endolytic murein transglycosylase n=1 Tax=Sporolactobacillus terrae TaxID=269673 RepID=A0A410D9V2_9BACL|nr:endolytic transglycosylase MltG [Sporolactobacillus terrae]QAA22872.1 endolytic transglycosylase MltG [Sporolactobacillus terrae]QAA25846.1 endolytic transglycosylase MltG [Sporolactobacillus terrae]UAK17720.1 endolytic transglycosylase MltG [Sporolactobacillus terrae]BBN99271.1 endolytic murein transglycosylase [Sporolactobacillus terrae]